MIKLFESLKLLHFWSKERLQTRPEGTLQSVISDRTLEIRIDRFQQDVVDLKKKLQHYNERCSYIS